MSDAPHDLRDYLFDELNPAERAEVEEFLKSSPEGRAEMEQLRLTHAALLHLPEEEIPRRIAFVSDPVLEPSAWQRLLRELLGGAPRFAMGMAAVLLVFFAGVWATEPTLAQTESGWSLAFGGNSTPPSTGVSKEEMLAAVRQEIMAGEARQMEAIAEPAASGEDVNRAWVAAQIADVRRELSEVHEDALVGYELVNSKYEILRRDVFQMDLASLREFGE